MMMEQTLREIKVIKEVGNQEAERLKELLGQAKMKCEPDRFTFQDLEAYTIEYLTAKLPDVPKDTIIEIATTLTYKYALANADSITARDRQWKSDMRRWNRREENPELLQG